MKAITFGHAFAEPKHVLYFSTKDDTTTIVFIDGRGEAHNLRTFNYRIGYEKHHYYRLTDEDVVNMILPRMI